jgi:hypothetical protein
MSLELPIFAIVGARPVTLLRTDNGGVDCLALDWETGELVRNMNYLSRVVAGDTEVDYVSEADFRAAIDRICQARGVGSDS